MHGTVVMWGRQVSRTELTMCGGEEAANGAGPWCVLQRHVTFHGGRPMNCRASRSGARQFAARSASRLGHKWPDVIEEDSVIFSASV